MLSQFCIRRPIFASVLSILIVLAGLIALRVLPISQYPNIAPPAINVSTSWDGANATVLARTVAAPIEDQLSGIQGLLYYNTSIRSNGNVRISCIFDVGTDPNDAVLEINNRVRTVEKRLPKKIQQDGISVRKHDEETLLMVAYTSPDKSMSRVDMADYALLNVVDQMRRLPGVGDVSVFGNSQGAMRIWLDPQRMAKFGITPDDIDSAINDKNYERGAGRIGVAPTTEDQQLFYTTRTKGQLLTPEEFGAIIIKADSENRLVRLRDVATVELGNRSYEMSNLFNGEPSITLAVFLQTGANAVAVSKVVKAELERLSHFYPKNRITHTITDDTTVFVNASLREVLKTLLEAGLLVLIVIFLFLQNWRATLIPMLSVPVSLIGTMAGLWVFNFSLNTLTLFALTLVIGIVVDDAIVVLENVSRLISNGMKPREAAKTAMHEVSGALVAIVLVLSSVFIPVAFLGGMAGELYRQFSVTVAVAVCLSGFVALTLTPALCAILLTGKPPAKNCVFDTVNRLLKKTGTLYLRAVEFFLDHTKCALGVFVGVCAAVYFLLISTPTTFVPVEDQGILRMSFNLPSSASFNRTEKEVDKMRHLIEEKLDGVESILAMVGNDQQSNDIRASAATFILKLKDWDKREKTAFELRRELQKLGDTSTEALAVASQPNPIRGLGRSSGFNGYIQARGNDDPVLLHAVADDFIAALSARQELTGVRHMMRASAPVIEVTVDEEKAMRLKVTTESVFSTLQSFFSGTYINDFTRNGKIRRVIMQAEPQYRMSPDDLSRCWVRSSDGNMIPLGSLITTKRVSGAESLMRNNGYLSAMFSGSAVEGVSSGEAVALVEQMAEELLPDGYGISWTGQAWHEKRIGSSSKIAFGFGVVIVFLLLAALYERWSLPIAVIMSVPFAVLGAVVALQMRSTPNDIYFQIGLLVLIGLSAKNAILIVEFASAKMHEGMSAREAALAGASLRLRPILMTSLAFVLGVLPLVFSTGAGAMARRSMGTGVCGGMIAATFIATIFVPVFFTWFAKSKRREKSEDLETKIIEKIEN